jgi:hypothetical protein
MNRQRFQSAGIVLSMKIVGFVVPAAAAELDTSDLARCAAVSGRDERLACYDALAAVSVPGVRIAPAPAAPAGEAPADAGQAAPAARTANPDDPANFGLTRHQLKVIPQGPDSIKAVVSQLTEDRLNNVYLVLDNGQTWGFIEPDPRVRPGDPVTIKRAALGSFLMTTPSRHSYRVQRVK